MKIYLVGDCGPEHNSVYYTCKTKKQALKRFQELRKDLLKEKKEHLKYWNDKGENFGQEMYEKMIKNLSEEDSQKIDNFPHETPYIVEMELE